MPSNSFMIAGAALVGMAVAQTGVTSVLTTVPVTNSAGSTIGSVAQPTGLYPITANASSTTSSLSYGTTASPTGASNSSNPDSFLCPILNNQVFEVNGHDYLIQCGVTYYGSFIDVNININQTSKAKRATVGNNLADCVDVCNNVAGCVGTSFNKVTDLCAFYGEIGAQAVNGDYDFALVTNTGVTVVPSGSAYSSPVYATVTSTISSCAATITNCPYNAAATAVVVAYTTVCPCTSAGGCTVAATPIACSSCSYSVGTATVYSSTVVNGVTTVVPVATAAIAYPSATGTTNGATTATASIKCSNSACSAVAAATQTGVQAFTGAAASVKAGMGMGAIMAVIALVL